MVNVCIMIGNEHDVSSRMTLSSLAYPHLSREMPGYYRLGHQHSRLYSSQLSKGQEEARSDTFSIRQEADANQLLRVQDSERPSQAAGQTTTVRMFQAQWSYSSSTLRA